VKCFFLWVDVLAHALRNELVEEHEEWLPILPQTVEAAARAPAEETEVAIELTKLNQQIRKLKDESKKLQLHLDISCMYGNRIGCNVV
jgi:hypothetical protein